MIESLKNIVQVSCSVGEKYCHTGCVDADGRVYTWGSAYKGKLGHSENWSHEDNAFQKTPKMIEAINDINISKIICGGIHTALLTNQGQVMTFGCGSDGRLGHSESDSKLFC
jgi:regulator of chromosome condensation